MAYSGSGDVNGATSYVAAPPTSADADALVWAGSQHYRPDEQVNCVEDGPMMRCR
jgi:hypothetical protein